jgi:hypothetical protein
MCENLEDKTGSSSTAFFPGWKFTSVKEKVEMSSSSQTESWMDRWWPLLLIVFGLIFVTLLTTFAPTV